MEKSLRKQKPYYKKNNYDTVGTFVMLCLNMGMELEELRESHEELQDHIRTLHEKVKHLDKELQDFRNCLQT
jgi:chaperonin cofactor prefoldin